MSLSECLSTLLQQFNVKQIFSGGNMLQSSEDDDDETRRPYLRCDLGNDGVEIPVDDPTPSDDVENHPTAVDVLGDEGIDGEPSPVKSSGNVHRLPSMSLSLKEGPCARQRVRSAAPSPPAWPYS